LMTGKLIGGVSAALLTPRLEDESVDVPGLRALVSFLMEKGVRSYAVNGATGEFCLTTPDQLALILQTVEEVSGGRAQVVCGVGAAGIAGTMRLVRVAERAKVKGLLLPMPYFFPYEQGDLEVFCRTVAGGTGLPILLYNLPQFTSGLEFETVGRLIAEVPNIVGIKDSSGSLEILRGLKGRGVDATCVVGNDSVFAQGLAEGVCDAVISGVACVLPEVLLALNGRRDDFSAAQALLGEFIAELKGFPTPWGLKWVAEARGVIPARMAQPVSVERTEAALRLKKWVRAWLPKALDSLHSPLSR
jgi:4-hydroxy-tetrahydrodipicolinate synthase